MVTVGSGVDEEIVATTWFALGMRLGSHVIEGNMNCPPLFMASVIFTLEVLPVESIDAAADVVDAIIDAASDSS